jgi:hypothetical protein
MGYARCAIVLRPTPGSPAPARSEQGGAVSGGNTPALARRSGGPTGLECGLDGVGDELGGLGVDGDIAAEQHAADHMACVARRVLRAVGYVSPLS